MANLVSLERVSLVFGTAHVLDEVSLGVQTGDRIGVVGVNGGGKSTLLRVMAGLQETDSGRITKQGGADGIHIGMLSQIDALDPAWTAWRHGSRGHGRSRQPRRPEVGR